MNLEPLYPIAYTGFVVRQRHTIITDNPIRASDKSPE